MRQIGNRGCSGCAWKPLSLAMLCLRGKYASSVMYIRILIKNRDVSCLSTITHSSSKLESRGVSPVLTFSYAILFELLHHATFFVRTGLRTQSLMALPVRSEIVRKLPCIINILDHAVTKSNILRVSSLFRGIEPI